MAKPRRVMETLQSPARNAMPQPVPLPIRQRLFTLAQRGWTAGRIAQHLQVPVRTVRHLLQRFRHHSDNLAPHYRPGSGRPAVAHPAHDFVLALRQQHPPWGAGYIRVQLRRTQPQLPLPSERTLQRGLRQQQTPPPCGGIRPAICLDKAAGPHEVWQIDAAEQLPLQNGQGARWLRLVDECTGAFLGTAVFPPTLLDAGSRHGDPAAVAAGFPTLGIASRHPRR